MMKFFLNTGIKVAIPMINLYLSKGIPFPNILNETLTVESATFKSFDNYVAVAIVPSFNWDNLLFFGQKPEDNVLEVQI